MGVNLPGVPVRPQCAYAELRTAAGPTLNRSRPGFPARDRELVGLLAPHVAQAFAREEQPPVRPGWPSPC
ncbi:hypothetical protein ACFVYA_40985 [Amycolatopsis sp. NPDC058278]|uniref:hypothetical protein n=1 Tax=Amycolatopsis sp. NPDC058278 TaxID=3346417 RepID=UPI0036DB866E